MYIVICCNTKVKLKTEYKCIHIFVIIYVKVLVDMYFNKIKQNILTCKFRGDNHTHDVYMYVCYNVKLV